MRLNKALILLFSLVLMLSLTAGVLYAEENKDKNEGNRVSKTQVLSSAMLDINQIECWVLNDGGFGTTPDAGADGFYFPKGQRTLSIIYTAGLWFLGKVDGEIRTAVQCYGAEFRPGSILAPDTPDDWTLDKYKVYKYNIGDVIDQDAIDQGCPEELVGDQMCFSVYNDIMSHEDMWKTPYMGVEVQHLVFGFNRTGALGMTVFQKFHIVNKSLDPFDACYVGVFYDPDLGFANDDYTGCDTTLGIAIIYNGDAYDEKYGVGVPAMASDFFQGPIVPAPGETAVLPDGTEIPDSKILGMTAYFAYINGAPIAGMDDPDARGGTAPQEAYYFVQGLLGNGDQWMDPTSGTPTATKFPFAGDPVAGTGWLFSSISVPDDVRMGNASGPFDLAPGESQDIVVGCVVGLGTDNLSSVTVMKFYDKAAQIAYDVDFDLPSPPIQPVVDIAEMDGELMVTWDDVAVAHDEDGYLFEGYNVYQGESVGGPWIKIATFDVANNITTIWDLEYAPSIGALVEMPVQFGTDSGVKHSFFVEKDYLSSIPLVNGRPYFFAVAAYAYNVDGVPKVLENAQNGVQATPQRPVLDTEYNSELGDMLVGTPSLPSDGICEAYVNNPAAVTGDTYEVSFALDTVAASPYVGELVYSLKNATTGEMLLEGRPQGGIEGGYITTEGLEVRVSGPASGFKTIAEVAYAGTPVDPPDNVWHSLNSNATYFFNSGNGNMSHLERYIQYTEPDDFEMRFTDGPSYGVFGFEDDLITTTPYELWRVGNGTFDDSNDDSQMIPFIYSNAGTAVDNGTDTGTEATWGYPCSDWIYWMDAEDVDGYGNFASQCVTTGAGNTYPYETDGSDQGYFIDFHGGFVYPIGRSIIADYNLGGAWPPAGTTVRLITKKPITEDLVFSFSTAEYKASKNADIAKERLDDINVFPNPYFAHNEDEGTFFTQFVTFNNLPEECTIRVFSLSGNLVITLDHTNGTPFERWYMLNDQEIPIASGMYIVHVQTDFGNKILKLAVVNRQAIFEHI